MCKSQIRNNRNREVYPNMLMPDELHNWLLVIGLYTRKAPAEYRPIGLGSHRPKARFSIPQAFPQIGRMAQRGFANLRPYSTYPMPVQETLYYSSDAIPPSANDSKRVQCFRKAIRTRPIGPLRCLEMMISARPCNSGSSCL